MADPLPQIIARVRRAMPRNADVMAVCDAAERATAPPAQSQEVTAAAEPAGKFDKRAYQREYMKRRRAAARAGG